MHGWLRLFLRLANRFRLSLLIGAGDVLGGMTTLHRMKKRDGWLSIRFRAPLWISRSTCGHLLRYSRAPSVPLILLSLPLKVSSLLNAPHFLQLLLPQLILLLHLLQVLPVRWMWLWSVNLRYRCRLLPPLPLVYLLLLCLLCLLWL